MEIEEQLERWVNGDPVHNDERDECCPDFSCCRGPDAMAPEEERRKFAEAHRSGNRELTNGMLMMFLSRAIGEIKNDEGEPVKVHVAGFEYG